MISSSSHIPKPTNGQVGLKNESGRLKTFRNWPVTHVIRPEKLAQAGFFYFNNSDAAKCYYCGGIIENWEVGDDPDREHLKHFPSCPFVKHVILPRIQMQDAIRESEAIVNMDISNHTELNNLGLISHQNPFHRKYVTLESRLQSFENWPKYLQPNPTQLAEAGFYYNGCGDEVFCFSCGGGIKHWEPKDDPWIEHAKYYGKCNYLLLAKGTEFVKDISEPAVTNGLQVKESIQIDHDNAEQNENASCCSKSDSNQIVKLEQENKRLKESRMCKICMDKEVGILFLPCRHLAVCPLCAPNLSKCPVCRKSIKVLVKTYFT